MQAVVLYVRHIALLLLSHMRIIGTHFVPKIEHLQKCLDYAHVQGYDPGGFRELQFVQGTRAWIGAVDICALLRSYGTSLEVSGS